MNNNVHITGRKPGFGTERLAFFLLLAPAFFLVTAFIVYPVINTVYYSLFKWNGFGPLTKFIGLQNLRTLFNDPLFWNAIKNNGIVILFSICIQLPIAFLLAMLVSKNSSKPTLVFRTIFFLPYILSEIITGVIFRFIYHPQVGLLKQLFNLIAPDYVYQGFLADPATVFPAILFVIFWKYFGFHMILYVAGLQGIPAEYYESARIDGASNRQTLWHITLPMMRTSIQMSLFFSIIGSIQIFDVIWSMGQGGPVHAAETAVVYLYKYGLRSSKIGFGSMVAIVIFIFCLGFNVVYQRVTKKEA